MENPSYTCLKPCRLTMTRTSCFYCGASNASWHTITRLFGLKHCQHHKSSAVRDCRAYLHEEKHVHFRDAFRHPILGPFLTALKDLENGFPVLRSSGEIQPGWTLNYSSFADTMISYDSGDWKLPGIWISPDGNYAKDINKYTPIANFKLSAIYEQIQAQLPNNFLEMVDKVLLCLLDGIYTKEYEEVQQLGAENYEDSVGVHIISDDGYVARILVPPPAVATDVSEENPGAT